MENAINTLSQKAQVELLDTADHLVLFSANARACVYNEDVRGLKRELYDVVRMLCNIEGILPGTAEHLVWE